MERIYAKLEELKKATRFIEDKLGKKVLNKDVDVQVSINGATGGYYRVREKEIRLNKGLWEVNPEAILEEILPHEYAHHIVEELYGRNQIWKKVQSHGIEWKSVMRMLGYEPKRTHSYNEVYTHSKKTYYIYKCECQKHHISKTIHNKMQKGQKRYCKRCKSFLKYTEKTV